MCVFIFTLVFGKAFVVSSLFFISDLNIHLCLSKN